MIAPTGFSSTPVFRVGANTRFVPTQAVLQESKKFDGGFRKLRGIEKKAIICYNNTSTITSPGKIRLKKTKWKLPPEK